MRLSFLIPLLFCFRPIVVAQEIRPALSPDQSRLPKQETQAEEAKDEVDTAVYLVHGLAEKILALLPACCLSTHPKGFTTKPLTKGLAA